ncbi:MAG: DUF2325 domain-containing protein [Polyangiaceae bacterium]
MHIGLIGGVERGERRYAALAEAEGHSFEVHSGDMAGRGGDTLAALVERSDLVVVVTDVNSHAAVLAARRWTRVLNRRCLLVRRFGFSRFRALLRELPFAESLAQTG